MNNLTRGVLIGFTVSIMVLLVVFPIVEMTGMWEMMGFGGMGGMMGQPGLIPWPAWLMLAFGLLIVGGLISLVVRVPGASDRPTSYE